MLYKVFIDESGSKIYKTPYSRDFIDNAPPFEKYEHFWRDNYFVLGAVRISQADIGIVNTNLNNLKIKYFGTSKVEIKSDWLRNPYQRRKQYFDLYGIEPDKLDKFGEEIISLISESREVMKIIGVVFDKRYYGDAKRDIADGNPLLKSSQAFFERLQLIGGYNIVVFDQMEDSLKLSKGKHGKILKVLRENAGMEQIHIPSYDKITDIKFAESSRENFLQLADICSYNIFRQFVHYGREWDGSAGKLEFYKYFDKIRCNFLKHPRTGQVRGIGLVCIPDIEKVDWNLLKGCN